MKVVLTGGAGFIGSHIADFAYQRRAQANGYWQSFIRKNRKRSAAGHVL